jgi:carbonic anhydrase
VLDHHAHVALGEMRAEGEIAIVGAMYDIETGEVSILA